MKIIVKVIPNAKENRIEKSGNNQFLVRVKTRPYKGQANQTAIEVVAEYFGVAKSCITLLKGQTSKQKTFEIKDALEPMRKAFP